MMIFKMTDNCSKKKEQFIRESKMFENYAVKIGDIFPNKDYKDIHQKKKTQEGEIELNGLEIMAWLI